MTSAYAPLANPVAPHPRHGNRRQKALENSTRQARYVLGAFAAEDIRPGPVLLIDDIVDSWWTLTIIGDLLRAGDSAPVYPVVLADTSGSGARR